MLEAKERIKSTDYDDNEYGTCDMNERHMKSLGTMSSFNYTVGAKQKVVPIKLVNSKEPDKPARILGWYPDWADEMEKSKGTGKWDSEKPPFEVPDDYVRPADPVVLDVVTEEVSEGKGVPKKKVSKTIASIDRDKFKLKHVPELLATYTYKELGQFLYAFRKMLCKDTGVHEGLFVRLRKLVEKIAITPMTPHGDIDVGVMVILSMVEQGMNYNEILDVVRDYAYSNYLVETLPGKTGDDDDDDDGFNY
jgi:hypothetical protein